MSNPRNDCERGECCELCPISVPQSDDGESDRRYVREKLDCDECVFCDLEHGAISSCGRAISADVCILYYDEDNVNNYFPDRLKLIRYCLAITALIALRSHSLIISSSAP